MSGVSLAVFRICVGLVMLLEAISCFRPSASTGNRIPLEVYYTGKDVTFSLPYEGFGWLPLLPPGWMEAVCVLMGVSAFLMAVGLFYRLAAVVTFLTWGYLYALESTRTYWMSYYYLEVLVLFLLIWMPAADRFSLDAQRKKLGPDSTIRFWPVFLLRAQLVVTYFYAGLAKVNGDWLFGGMPMRMYLNKPYVAERVKAIFPTAVSAGIDQILHAPWLAYLLSWSGAAFDLGVGFLLLFRRTRAFGMLLMLLFHSINHFILFNDIVWFPLVGITTACIFLEPGWPSRFAVWLSRPKLPKPDWKWFLGGGILFPVVGAALGWKSTPSSATDRKRSRMPAWVVPAVASWIVWQTLVPLRHWAIPGDARFTFEGLSWSWRLKSEVYQSRPCVITIHDPALSVTNAAGTVEFDWSKWAGEKVIVRQIKPDLLDWSQLPEIVVVLEPLTGERIFYNPNANPAAYNDETAVKARIEDLWRGTFGRSPESVSKVVPLSQILAGYERAMRPKGYRFSDPMDVLDTLIEVNGRRGDGQMVPVLRRMEPFSLESKRSRGVPLWVIEDRALFRESSGPVFRLNTSVWKQPSNAASAPAVILRGALGIQEGELLPRYYVADTMAGEAKSPVVRWNLFKDVGPSKAMHVGMQPFLLRRYAQRVAAMYEHDFSRRPQVRARANLSLNGHPEQMLVDPAADLGSVPACWFGHNSWIRDFTPESRVHDETTSPEPLRSLEEAVPRSGDRGAAVR